MSGVNKRTSLSLDIARILRGKPLMTGVALAVLQTKTAGAVSLGELRVQSALGQPLVATTMARIGPGESIASNCITAPKGNDGINNPDGLKIAAQSGNTPGSYPVQIRTTQPLYEPMYEIRLQIDCPGGVALAKSYVVMLNLPMSTTTGNPAAQVAAPDQVAAPGNAVRQQSSTAPTNIQRARSSARLAASRAPISAGSEYRVRSGDTLSVIAERISGRPVGSTWQVAEMLYQNNPQAFIRGNRDMIKLGAVLTIPDVASLGGTAPATVAETSNASEQSTEQPTARGDARNPVALGRPEESPTAELTAGTETLGASNEELLREIRAEQEARNLDTVAEAGNSPFADVVPAEQVLSSEANAVDTATEQAATVANTPEADSAAAVAIATNADASTGSNPFMAIIAGILMGALLALVLLGRNLIAPLLEGRERRKAALKPSTASAATSEEARSEEKFATVQVGTAPTRPAYGGAGIDVELSDNASAAAEASQIMPNPFTAEADDDSESAEEPVADAPRISLRGNDDHATSDFDTMLEDLEDDGLDKTERFEAPKPNSTVEDSGKSPLMENTGTMRSLFDESVSESLGENSSTLEMPDQDSPTVEMNPDSGATAELPTLADNDTATEEVVDVDITDLESLSNRLSNEDGDDRLSATLTQALDLLEQDYEDEFTQSQILEQQEVANAFSEHKSKD